MEDSPKDIIELKDVLAVAPMRSVPGAPKKAEDSAFFEVQLAAIMFCVTLALQDELNRQN